MDIFKHLHTTQNASVEHKSLIQFNCMYVLHSKIQNHYLQYILKWTQFFKQVVVEGSFLFSNHLNYHNQSSSTNQNTYNCCSNCEKQQDESFLMSKYPLTKKTRELK